MSAVHHREINIDENSDPSYGWGVNMDLFGPLGQSFTAVSHHVRFIGLFFSTSPNIPPVQFKMTLLEGAGFSGPVVHSRYATATPGLYGFLYFDFSGTKLTVGKAYTATVIQDPPVNAQNSTEILGTSNVYSGGTAFFSGAPDPNGDDCYFRALHVIYTAQVLPPIDPNGTSTFNQGEHVRIKFKLEADGVPTHDLPRAKLVLGGGFKGNTVVMKRHFHREKGEYVYELHTKHLAAQAYKVEIFIHDIEVGNALFTLQ
jgi:hypothetical protein